MSFISLPEIDGGVATATMVRWLAKAGDSLEPGRAIAEVETEDRYLILEAVAPGRLTELLVQPGQTFSVGAKLARVEHAESARTSDASDERTETAPVETASADQLGKVVPILMPQAGNTMEEGTVIAWHVKEGDQIAVGQVLCEIETDKATMDFESPDAGRLARIVAKLDEPVAVKNLIAVLADNNVDADEYLASQGSGASTTPVQGTVATPATANGPDRNSSTAVVSRIVGGRVKASPAARKVAAERGIALAAVSSGSGPGGRILSSDVVNVSVPSTLTTPMEAETRRPLSKMRRAIGLNLQQSKQTVPHFYLRSTINADALLQFYRERKSVSNCTLNDIIVLAVGRTIREFPAVRSHVVGDEIVEYPHANIGIAVGIDDGLVVPVVLAVDTLSLGRLATETKRVVAQARSGRLENIGKGHFTISNLGMFGVDEFSAIINPPESGILAVSAAREAVIVESGAMRVGYQMTMTLSADHRVVDGVMAAKFMQRLRAILENPGEELS